MISSKKKFHTPIISGISSPAPFSLKQMCIRDRAFTLTDESDVTVQAQEAFSFDEDATARQILKVK